MVEDMTSSMRLLRAEVAKICNRHFGVGADGLIVIRPSAVADFEMVYFNADGTKAEMCGNGIRCLTRYAIDHKLTVKTDLDIETLAGVKHVSSIIDDSGAVAIKVDMGEPEFAAGKIPAIIDAPEFVDVPIEVEGRVLMGTALSMGNPHCVFFVDSLDGIALAKVGPYIEHSDMFPNRVNVEFVAVESRDSVSVRVWERGVGETLACGTGACAVVAAGVKTGRLDHRCRVTLPGGHLDIEWIPEGSMFMSGAAHKVFSGEVEVDRLPTREVN